MEAVAPKNQKGEERGGGGGSARALLKNKEHTESLLLFLLIQATLPLLLLRTVAHVSVRVCGVGDGGIEKEPRAFCAADRRFPSFPSPRAPQCIIMWGGERGEVRTHVGRGGGGLSSSSSATSDKGPSPPSNERAEAPPLAVGRERPELGIPSFPSKLRCCFSFSWKGKKEGRKGRNPISDLASSLHEEGRETGRMTAERQPSRKDGRRAVFHSLCCRSSP